MTSPRRSGPARDAAIHILVTFAVGIVVLIAAMNTSGGLRDGLIIAGPVVVGIGAIAAMIRTALAWRANVGWQVWQGASWFLLALTVTWVFGAVPAVV
ncbi:hypothetical protein [Gordonia humi]|uniref:Uncharacterized protein n=1 Tax=Gordonia humi TaxID=686429 RepID=A0A840EYD2_9ACTN|nr:hypothetical protein [Gordonia humi]MBB4135334.1 hypothetical protein [Gordonia humi]